VVPKVIKTNNIDLFLHCDDMTLEELLIATELEDQKDFGDKNLLPKTEEHWATNEEVKRGDQALLRAA
jgi:hypothetical protein